jgi:predicted DNA-binding transcriptional regulator YafY
VLKAGKWYLVARCGGHLRTYRVSQILGLTTLEGQFERPDGFDLKAYWERSITDFRAGLHQDQATIRLSPAGRQRMRELMSSAVIQTADQTATAPDDHGWVTAMIPVESLEHAQAELLRLGGEVEVLAPPALRDRMRQTALSLSRMYAPMAGSRRACPDQALPGAGDGVSSARQRSAAR